MDVVTDLSSQCVSFITVFQEVCKERIVSEDSHIDGFAFMLGQARQILHTEKPVKISFNKNLQTRISEIIWVSRGKKTNSETVANFVVTCSKLVIWIDTYRQENTGFEPASLFSSSYEWRQCIREILYADKEQRIVLADVLQYMPIQIILCLGGKNFDFRKQRILQIWKPDDKLNILSQNDKDFNEEWWGYDAGTVQKDNAGAEAGPSKKAIIRFKKYWRHITFNVGRVVIPGDVAAARVSRAARGDQLLKNDSEILAQLQAKENPIPFETLFTDELDEIVASRELRKKVAGTATFWEDAGEDSLPKGDPVLRAGSLNLYALAFSGGGIRSATFNLGILQKLAETGLLSRFDYLSTVSGGGYIGSWFASWVKRNGSIGKVMDRLNPKKSMNPLSDEVRPIRWLRMFSNYLAPNASLMSVDSWTMGITWLRNTIINQIVLLLLLCSALSSVKVVYKLWWVHKSTSINPADILVYGSFVLISGAILAGLGMSSFEPDRFPGKFNIGNSKWIYSLLIVWGGLSTFMLSTWFFNNSEGANTFNEKLYYLLGTGAIGFFAFILVAVIGRYDICERADKKYWKVFVAIAISSLIAAGCGLLLLTLNWQILAQISKMELHFGNLTNSSLAFIVGVPMILETISITVVVRMAIMGVLFPDLRREWWGRMGALVHRFIFIWLLVAGCALFLPACYMHLQHAGYFENLGKTLPVIFGGWTAIIGYAVKLAYGSKNSGQAKPDGSLPASEIFIRTAPYLFAIGFVLIGAVTLKYIENIVNAGLFKIGIKLSSGTGQHIIAALLLGGLTYLLSRCIGVNEFSLHHFFRNRLSRAYLGATRRREDRDKTVNSFTGFDGNDDLLLTDLQVKHKFSGPYPIINVTLNSTVVSDLDRQDRMAESFVFTPKYCGFDFCRARPSANSETNPYEYGYRPTARYAYPEGPHLSTAMTISGAAVNPNMGFHSSAAIAFLLTIFNVRLGWWMGNPRKESWKKADPTFGLIYLIKDLFGSSNVNSQFVCLSDGGHFDNMGVYELVRRKCRHIVLCDAEEDENSSCDGLANAIRRCRIDFGVEIALTVDPITTKDEKTKYCKQHLIKGTIWYPGDKEPSGTIVYIKTSLTGDESVDIREYFIDNPAFPQQSTADQFFDESQFESYRKLGYSSIK